MKTILRAVAISGAGSLVTMMLGAITTKIIAVLLGPAGIGLYAQLRQIIQWFVTLATMNGQGSLVRGIACRGGQECKRFIGVVGATFTIGAVLSSVIIILASPLIAKGLFAHGDENLIVAIKLIPVAVFSGVAAAFVIGVINGYREIKSLTLIQVAGSLAGAVLAYPIARSGHPAAYVVIVSVGYMTVSILGGWLVLRLLQKQARLQKDASFVSNLLREHIGYSSTLLVTGLVGAGSVVLIRTMYIHSGGMAAGGYFDAAWTLSMTYVMLLLSSFGTYYFPTLSSKKTPTEINECVNQVMHVAIVLGTILVSFVVAVKPLLIGILYSEQFEASADLLRWMLVGDYLKVSGWVFGMLLLAFSERKNFFASELLWQGAMVLSVATLIGRTIEIAGMAFLAVNALYLIYVWWHAFRKYEVRIVRRTIALWVIGLVMVLGMSALAWGKDSFPISHLIGAWLFSVALYLIVASNRHERRVAWAWVRARLARH